MSLVRFAKVAVAAAAMLVAGFVSFSTPAAAAHRAHHGYHAGHHRAGHVRVVHRRVYHRRPVYRHHRAHRRPIYRPYGAYRPYAAYGRHCFVRKTVRFTPYGREVVRRRICR